MKAVICEQYGQPEDVLRLADIEKPTPKSDEVLVKIHAVSLNAVDWALVSGDPFLVRLTSGFLKPKNRIPGADIAGRVEAVGEGVQMFKPGDAVFGDLSGCGFGGLSEYVSVPEDVLAKKPDSVSFENAAAVPMAAVTALQGLRDHGKIQPGQKVLINGASGGVGTFAVQLAKHFGAEVTAVCSSGKMDLVQSLGADHVIDYAHEDFTANGQQYDLILAVNGYHPISHYKRALSSNGIYVAAGGKMAQIFQAMLLGGFMSMRGNKKLGNMLVRLRQSDLIFMAELLEAGEVTPVLDRSYPLTEIHEAFRYLGQKHAKGKVIVTVIPA